MSEERRISLAELLAREGGAPTPPTGGRRRRHRGGENSITVAELTGEIPVVRDDTPAPAPTRASAPEPQVESAPQPQAAAEPEPVEPESVESSTVEPEIVEPVAVEPEAVEAPAQDDDEPITSSFLAAAVADPGPAAQAPEVQAPADEVAVDAVEAELVDEAEAPVARESRRSGLLRWGRGNRSQKAEQASSEEAPAAELAPEATAPEATAPGAVEAPAAEVEPESAPAQADEAATQAEDGTDYAWSRWDQAETPIMATADFNTAQIRERQSRFAEVEADDTVDVAPVSVPETTAPSAPDTAALSAERIDAARAETPDFLAESDEKDEDAEKAPSTGKGRGWLILAAEVVLGLLAGAGLFFGFFKLWNWGGGMPTIALTVVLAFIVIIAIVTFTHYLRKTTDYLTLGLALFVGLVITFGPLLMALGSN